MPSNKPSLTLRIDKDEYEKLKTWAAREFMTPPQLARIILKKAIAKNAGHT